MKIFYADYIEQHDIPFDKVEVPAGFEFEKW